MGLDLSARRAIICGMFASYAAVAVIITLWATGSIWVVSWLFPRRSHRK
jgi:hypothetical protein